MSSSIWIAIGLVCLIEGLGPFLVPEGWRKMISQIIQQPTNQLRRMGGCFVIAGIVILVMLLK